MIVSMISQKGGVGKSTIARSVAVELVNAGWSVKIADLDTHQGTSTKWKIRRDAAGFSPEIPVEKYKTVDRALKESAAYDAMILDGPAHADRNGLLMAQASDLVVLPTSYSLDDMEPAVEVFYDLEEKGVDPAKIAVVFTAKGTSLNAAELTARSYFKRAGITPLKPVMPHKTSIETAMMEGKSASEIAHKGLKGQVINVVSEITKRLKKGAK